MASGRGRGSCRFYAIEAGLVGGSQWVLSMDIGQAVDPSAITIVEKIEQPAMAELRNDSFKREFVTHKTGREATTSRPAFEQQGCN